jgi:hypothetical protein
MTDYSESTYVPDSTYAPEIKLKSTVFGIDIAILVVVFSALAFWAAVGVTLWWLL